MINKKRNDFHIFIQFLFATITNRLLMDNFQIETSQNIKINQDIASLGLRIGATLLDGAVIYIYFFVIMLAYGTTASIDEKTFNLIIIVAFIPIIFYNLLFEYFMNGQTPGKKIVKIQVVKTDGSPPGFIEYFLRWLFRLIEVQLALGIIAIITFLLNGKGQRLGDIVADTTVITLKKPYKSKNIFINIDEDYIPTFPHVTLFSDEDMTKIKELYIKARRNRDWNLMSKLSDKVKEKLNIESELDDIEFVKTIIKDYYYYYYYDNEMSSIE